MRFKSVQEILDDKAISRLGYNTSKFFASIFNQMSLRNAWEVRVVNQVAADRAKVTLDGLRDYHRKLIDLGLLEIEHDTRPGFVFSAQCTTYRWPVHKRPQAAS